MGRRKSSGFRKGLVAEVKESGLSQRAFAEQMGVPFSTLTYWLRKEKLEAELEGGDTTLVSVSEIPPLEPTSNFRLRRGDVSIELPRDTTTEEWQRLLQVWG